MGFRLFILLIIPVLGWASPAEEPEEQHIPILDSAQELFGSQVNVVANRFDLFFADQRADDELARSRLRVREQYEVRDGTAGNERRIIRFNIKLPRIQDRFRFDINDYLGKKKEKQSSLGGGDVGKAQQHKDKQDAAFARLLKDWQFRADTGVITSINPIIFSRARIRKNWETGKFIHRFVEEINWQSDENWKNFSTYYIDHSLTDDLLFRFSNTTDWRITRKDFTTAHGPGLFQRLGPDDALNYSAGLGSSVINGTWFVTGYNLSINYRRNLYKQWIYGDLTPGLAFPKDQSWRRQPYIFFGLEALFGGY